MAIVSPDEQGAGTEVEPGACLDLDALERRLPELRERYREAPPFPHIAIDDFLRPDVAHEAVLEVPPVDREHWINYVHANERKFGNTEPSTWGPALQAIFHELTSPRFLEFLSGLTGIEGLIADPGLEGGGLHQTRAGGFLNIHADFTVHPYHQHWHRRANLLVYLNEEWPAAYGGDLELWSRDMTTRVEVVAPVANRAVIFTTGADTWHGHPDPLRCPADRARQSLALYYYTVEEKPMARSTEYRARPGDGPKAILIYLDKELVRAYYWIKRRAGLSDERSSRLLGRFGRKRSSG